MSDSTATRTNGLRYDNAGVVTREKKYENENVLQHEPLYLAVRQLSMDLSASSISGEIEVQNLGRYPLILDSPRD
jgi:hypothetical protein